MNTAICGPTGSFVNHVRWLLLLSPEYVFPKPNGYSKCEFITNMVYNSDRTFSNWIKWEYKFRENTMLQKLITLNHRIANLTDKGSDVKIINLSIDSDIALKHYFKFNPTLNGVAKDSTNTQMVRDAFRQHIELEIKENINNNLEPNQILQANAGLLDTDVLDEKLYNDIVSFLNISNVYDEAATIHRIWRNLNHTIEDSIRENYNICCDNWVWTLWNKPNDSEMAVIKKLMKELYK